MRHRLVVEEHLTTGGSLQPADHPQRRGLPTARRPDQGQKFPVGIGQRQVIDRNDTAELLAYALESDFSHRYPFTEPAAMPCTINRWQISTSTKGGATATTPAADIKVTWVFRSVAKFAAITGMVCELMVLVMNGANMNSFQAVMKANIAAATRLWGSRSRH